MSSMRILKQFQYKFTKTDWFLVGLLWLFILRVVGIIGFEYYLKLVIMWRWAFGG